MPVARRMSGFGVIHHTGRRSGRRYHTPLNCFPVDDAVIVALTYGPDTDWLANIEAGPATLESVGTERAIRSVEMIRRGRAWPHLPGFVRFLLRLVQVEDFVLISLGGAHAVHRGHSRGSR